MTDRRRSQLAVATAGLAYAAWLTGLVVAYRYRVAMAGGAGIDLRSYLDTALFSLAWSGFPAVGALLAVRRPRNPVGWMVLAVGVAMYAFDPVMRLAELAAVRELVAARSGEVAGPLLWGVVTARGGEIGGLLLSSAAIANALAMLPVLALVHLLLFFPAGELGRWGRWLSRLALAAAGLVTLARLLRPGRLDLAVWVDNPWGQPWAAWTDDFVAPLTSVVMGTALLALVRLVVRYRRADRSERKQFQWILASVATFPVVWMLGNSLEEVNYWVGQFTTIAAFDLAFLGFALALYRAISRHDLYGIDRLVSRTLAYVLLVVVLVGVYVAGVIGLGAVARALTAESGDLVVALSTLAVAAMFQPLRRRVRRLVDRRFNRERYDAARTVAAFGRGLRDQVDLEAIQTDLAATAARTFRPGHVGVVLAPNRTGP